MRHKRVLFAALVLPVIALAIACGGKKATTDGEGAAPTTAAQPTLAGQQPTRTTPAPGAQASPTQAAGQSATDELRRLADNFATVRSYKATILTESPGTREELTIEAVLPDRLRMTLPGGVQRISIGNDSWLNFGTGWVRQPGGGGAGLPLNPNDLRGIIAGYAAAGVATRGGTETIDGKRCQAYTVRLPSESTELCVTADGMPLRIVNQSGGSKVTITFTELNANISIQAPN